MEKHDQNSILKTLLNSDSMSNYFELTGGGIDFPGYIDPIGGVGFTGGVIALDPYFVNMYDQKRYNKVTTKKLELLQHRFQLQLVDLENRILKGLVKHDDRVRAVGGGQPYDDPDNDRGKINTIKHQLAAIRQVILARRAAGGGAGPAGGGAGPAGGGAGQNFQVLSPREAAVMAAIARNSGPRFGKKNRRKMFNAVPSNYKDIIKRNRQAVLGLDVRQYTNEYQRLNKIDHEIELDQLRLRRYDLEKEDEETHKTYYNQQGQPDHVNTDELNDIYKRILALDGLLGINYEQVDGGEWTPSIRLLKERLARNKARAASRRLPETQDASFGKKIRRKMFNGIPIGLAPIITTNNIPVEDDGQPGAPLHPDGAGLHQFVPPPRRPNRPFKPKFQQKRPQFGEKQKGKLRRYKIDLNKLKKIKV